MALFRLKISDGVTTINLYDGTDAKMLEGGLNLPPPAVQNEFIGNPFSHGDRLSASRFGNRQININLKIWGSTLADCKDNVRAIQQVLNDARERTLSSYGAVTYLECQWGDTDGQSTFFDILYGELALPNGFTNVSLLSHYTILNAELRLICKPFGRYANTSLNAATLQNGCSAYTPKDGWEGTADNFQYCDANDDRIAMTFTATVNHNCIAVAMQYAYLTGVPSDWKVELWSVDGAHKPLAMLKSIDMDETKLTTTAAGKKMLVAVFASAQALVAGTEYAIVTYATADATHQLAVGILAAGGYAGGATCTSIDAGATWVVGAPDAPFVTLITAANNGYQAVDISATTPVPDVASRMYLKVAQSGAAGSTKMWVGRRSSPRDTDDLWLEGEEFTSFTDVSVGAGHTITGFGQPAPTCAGGGCARATIAAGGVDAIGAGETVCRFDYTFTAVPGGHYRVLARCHISAAGATGTYDDIGIGVGYSYGTHTKTPAKASGEFNQLAAITTWETLDIGEIVLPPIAESDLVTNPSLSLRVFIGAYNTLAIGDSYIVSIDSIMLMPIDEQVAIVNSVSSSYALAIDGISVPPALLLIDGTNVIQSHPDWVGQVLKYGREDFRIYALRNDDPLAVTFTTTVTYQPEFMVV